MIVAGRVDYEMILCIDDITARKLAEEAVKVLLKTETDYRKTCTIM